MSVSCAGIDLTHPDAELAAWIESACEPRSLWEFAADWWPARNTAHLDWRPAPPGRPVRVNRLWWPQGATRFGVFHGLADQGQLDAIRAVVFASDTGSDTYAAADLVMSSGADSITTSLWLLPARPLAQIAAAEGVAGGLYLLTLVDDRYWWWQKPNTVTITGGTTTWAQLFTSIGTALGVTLTVDDVPASYLKPAAPLSQLYEPLPVLLDAAALSVGLRVVRALDGTVRLWSAGNSRDQVADNLAALEDGDVCSGGTMQLGG